jgi:hypothetical protein
MQGVWWSHCFNAGGFHCYETEKIVRRLASADVGNGVTITDLINLSPSTMQIVGAFEILSVIVGWSSSNVLSKVIEIQAREFVGLAEFRFCQDFSRTFFW